MALLRHCMFSCPLVKEIRKEIRTHSPSCDYFIRAFHQFIFLLRSACLLAFLHPDRLPKMCPSATLHSWPTVHVRLAQLFTVVDPA